MNALDKAVEQAAEERQLTDAEIDKAFVGRVENAPQIKEPLAGVPVWTKEIRDYTPTVQGVLAKVGKTKYASDVTIIAECGKLQAGLNAPATMAEGLRDLQALKANWRTAVKKRGLFNAANDIIHNTPQKLIAGRGARAGMERAVSMIESRLAYLMEHAMYGQPTPTPTPPSSPRGGVVPPPSVPRPGPLPAHVSELEPQPEPVKTVAGRVKPPLSNLRDAERDDWAKMGQRS